MPPHITEYIFSQEYIKLYLELQSQTPRFLKDKIIQNMTSDHNRFKLEIINRKKTGNSQYLKIKQYIY